MYCYNFVTGHNSETGRDAWAGLGAGVWGFWALPPPWCPRTLFPKYQCALPPGSSTELRCPESVPGFITGMNDEILGHVITFLSRLISPEVVIGGLKVAVLSTQLGLSGEALSEKITLLA